MNRGAGKLVLECGINKLMLTHTGDTSKRCRGHRNLQVVSRTREILNGHMGIGEGCTDGSLNSGWSNHDQQSTAWMLARRRV